MESGCVSVGVSVSVWVRFGWISRNMDGLNRNNKKPARSALTL